jgi:hypothetical protein
LDVDGCGGIGRRSGFSREKAGVDNERSRGGEEAFLGSSDVATVLAADFEERLSDLAERTDPGWIADGYTALGGVITRFDLATVRAIATQLLDRHHGTPRRDRRSPTTPTRHQQSTNNDEKRRAEAAHLRRE